uniref:Uncharacterized protein n=1 Tax=Rhizophora mucronata TaxID=61149 RepID=A0A2P2QIX4_RHIMU
MVTGLLVI